MIQDKQDDTLNTIINGLFLKQIVNPNLLDQLKFAKSNDIAGYLGLMNFLYNIVRRKFIDVGAKVEENQSHLNLHKGSDILKMRGQIFKQYVKMLKGVLPDPAYFIARFDYQTFNQHCVHRGVSYLTRHTRGIYPEIDTKKTPLLQFLPFYNDLSQKQALVGNANYKAARRQVEMFYNKEIKTGNIKEDAMQDESKSNLINLRHNHENNDSESQLKNGVLLTYILILEKTDEMENYIAVLKDFIQNNSANDQQLNKDMVVFNRFLFWYRNYKSYIHEGMSMYEKRQDSAIYPLVYACDENNLEQTIIRAIQLALSLEQNSSSTQTLYKIQQKLKNMIEFVKDSNVVPGDDPKFKNNAKNLLLAYIYSMDQILIKNREGKYLGFAAYQQTCTFTPIEEPYYRIFYTNKELVELYESGKISQYPVRYDFGLLNRQILRAICRNNPHKIVDNIRRLQMMETAERLRFLVRSPLIGDYQSLKGDQPTEGEKIIQNFSNYRHEFEKDLIRADGKTIDAKATSTLFEKFIRAWKEYYYGMRHFDTKTMQIFLEAYQEQKKKNVILKLPHSEPEAKVKEAELVHPMSRPNITYSVTNRFAGYLAEQQKEYLNNLQRYSNKDLDYQTESELRGLQSRLAELLKICQQEQFKEMLSRADPSFVIDSEQIKKQEISAQQEEHQDQFWRIYANTCLCLGDYCKRLIGNKSEIDVEDEEDEE